jgi:hypothetical protein
MPALSTALYLDSAKTGFVLLFCVDGAFGDWHGMVLAQILERCAKPLGRQKFLFVGADALMGCGACEFL